MKTQRIDASAYILRSSAVALLVSCVIVALSSAISLPNKPPKVPTPQDNTAFGATGHESAASVAAPAVRRNRTLTFGDRVAYQRAIEDVYWEHRIWPKANPEPKPPLEKVMSRAQLEKKVEDYLRNSQALEDYWQRPITPDQLQAEMERMASQTKQPGVLREIFAALGNDPFVIAECLARPVMAERMLTELYAHDQRFHGELKRRAEAELRTHRSVRQMKQTSGMYTEMEWIRSEDTDLAPSDALGVVATPLRGVGRNVPPAFAALRRDKQARGYSERHGAPDGVTMTSSEWQGSVEKLAKEFGSTKASDALAQIKTGVVSPLQEDEGHYYAVAVMKKGKDRLKLATVAWLKEPLRSWLAKAEAQVPVTLAEVSANYTLPVIAGLSGNSSPLVVCPDDTWTPTSRTNAPAGRIYHTAVWSGSEMIVWGGYDSTTYFNTGGRYNPSTDSWTAISTTNPPTARYDHTAVWTGSAMIIWGGWNASTFFNTGGRYNPSTDSWTTTSTANAPAARHYHTAVWTGSEMIVWGGADASGYFNTGGRYNPSTDRWTITSTTSAPGDRQHHTAVWTGSQMIVWGGYAGGFNYLNTGGRYNPSDNSWAATSTTNAAERRALHTAVWTGTEMIVWGGFPASGYLNTGGRYNPSTDSWTSTNTINAPSARYAHTAVWTGSDMIVWGGYDGSLYFSTGGRYNASDNSWIATSLTNVPDLRASHAAVWTGSQMIVWGGASNTGFYFNTGGRYCAAGLGTHLSNISTRAFVQTGDNVMIGGFIVEGTTTKRVIIRAIGPELSLYGVPNPLQDPTLELHNGTGALIASNDDWQHTIIGGIITNNQAPEIQGSGHAPGDLRESAIIADLPAGNYTAIVRGVTSTTGVALVEVYDYEGVLGPGTNSILGNISTRSFVQTGDNVMIGGFIVEGTTTKRVIIRAIGPELSLYGVPNPLQDPTLELHNGTGALIASNDNWRTTIIGGIITSDQVVDIRNSGHAPGDPRESAIIADLPVGNYTAIVRGVSSTTGVALVEVYDLD